MWRPAHGATSRPGPCRPASGYGRQVGRPGPCADEPIAAGPPACAFEPAWLVDPGKPGETVDRDAEAPAPVTP
jgi:hypothetical protein